MSLRLGTSVSVELSCSSSTASASSSKASPTFVTKRGGTASSQFRWRRYSDTTADDTSETFSISAVKRSMILRETWRRLCPMPEFRLPPECT